MKHTIEIKLPKIFGKGKKKDETKEPLIKTEIDVGEEVKTIPQHMLLGGTLVVGITLGYLVGHKNGVGKGGNVIVIK